MTEHTPNEPIDFPGDLSPGARVRGVADGELTGERGERGERVEGVDRCEERVEFERRLREAVHRSMSGPETEAPAALRDRVEAVFREGAKGEGVAAATGGETGDVIRTPMGDTRERSFWSRIGGIAAVAAVLTVCAVFVVSSLRQSQSNQGTGAPVATLQAGMLTAFIRDEHQHCAGDDDYSHRKFRVRNASEAADVAESHLGGVPSILRTGLERVERAGYTFFGISPCAVPGKGKSVHIAFHKAADPSDMVSLFVQVDEHEWRLADSRCAIVRKDLPQGATMTAWRIEGFLCFLYAAREDDLAAFRTALSVPEKVCRLSHVR